MCERKRERARGGEDRGRGSERVIDFICVPCGERTLVWRRFTTPLATALLLRASLSLFSLSLSLTHTRTHTRTHTHNTHTEISLSPSLSLSLSLSLSEHVRGRVGEKRLEYLPWLACAWASRQAPATCSSTASAKLTDNHYVLWIQEN